MNKGYGVALIALSILFVAGAGLNMAMATALFLASSGSSYSIGAAIGRGLIGILFVLIAVKVFGSGRAKLRS